MLRRVETPDKPSSLGPFSYEAIDTKLSRETRGSTILQLSFYSDLLGALQGVQPEFFHVVTPIASEKYRVADFAAYYRLVKRRLEEAAASDTTALLSANYPEPVDHCDVCRWDQQCDKRRHADDHLSLVAGITRLNRREFEANDVKTLERLGDLVLPIPFKPAKCSKESLEKAQGQARIQLAGRRAHAPIHELLPVEDGRGLSRLPEPSPGDVFLDLEGDHFADEGPREYLFGMTIVEGPGKTRHVSKWAVDAGRRESASSKKSSTKSPPSGKPTRGSTSTTTRPTSPPRSRGSWAGTPRAPASSTACCAPSCSSTSWPSSSRA